LFTFTAESIFKIIKCNFINETLKEEEEEEKTIHN
jgi:hypothetical protein